MPPCTCAGGFDAEEGAARPAETKTGVARPMPPPSRALLALLTKKCHASQERPQVDEWARLPPQVDGQIEDEQTYRCTSRSPSPHSPQCRRTFPPIATALPEATAAPLPPLCPASCTPPTRIHRLCVCVERSEPGGGENRNSVWGCSKHGIDYLMHIEVPFNQENNMKRSCIGTTHEKV